MIALITGGAGFIGSYLAEKLLEVGEDVMAIDNLPCELPRESSYAFSNAFNSFVPEIAKADFTQNYDDLDLPSAIKKAVILYHGRLTPDYHYINKYL